MSIAGPDTLPHPSPQPPAVRARRTHLVVVLVDVLVELVQGHARPEVSRAVLEKTEATEMNPPPPRRPRTQGRGGGGASRWRRDAACSLSRAWGATGPASRPPGLQLDPGSSQAVVEPGGQDAALASPVFPEVTGPLLGASQDSGAEVPYLGSSYRGPVRSKSEQLTPNTLSQSCRHCGCHGHRFRNLVCKFLGLMFGAPSGEGGRVAEPQQPHRLGCCPQTPAKEACEGGRALPGGLCLTRSRARPHPGQLGQQRIHLLVAGGDGLSDVSVVPAGGRRSEVVGTAAAGAQTSLTPHHHPGPHPAPPLLPPPRPAPPSYLSTICL